MNYANFHLGQQIGRFTNPGSSQGELGGFVRLENVDPHTEVGSLTCSKKRINHPNSILTEPTIAVTSTDGTIFFFSLSTGRIWKKTVGGAFSLVGINTQGAHKGAGVFDKKMWYATATKLGRFNADVGAGSRTDNFGTFAIGSQVKPFLNSGIAGYFGDDDQVASITSIIGGAGGHNFNDNAIDSLIDEYITAIGTFGDDIFFASSQQAKTSRSGARRWNQIASSYFTPDFIGEKGIAMIASSDSSNISFAITTDGKIYYYTGAGLEIYHKGINKEVPLNPYNAVQHKGHIYFAVEDKIYTIQRADRNLPFAIHVAHTCSVAGADIHSLCSDGDELYATWSKDGSAGVDITSNDYEEGVVETTTYKGKPRIVRIMYDDMPNGTSIELEVKCNNDIYKPVQVTDHKQNYYFQMVGGLPQGNINIFQARVKLIPNGAATPRILDIIIE